MPQQEIRRIPRSSSPVRQGLAALAGVVKSVLGSKGSREVQLGKLLVIAHRPAAYEAVDRTRGGSATTARLSEAIYAEAARLLAAGAHPHDIKRGIEGAVRLIVVALAAQSKAVKDLSEVAHIATISAGGDALVGQLIAEAIEKAGREGVVVVEEGTSIDTALEFAPGMQLDRGYLSPRFITGQERKEVVLEDAFVLLMEDKLLGRRALLPLLKKVSSTNRSLIVIAEDVDGEALAALIADKLQNSLQVCAIKAQGFGANRAMILQDLAILCGGKVVSEGLGVPLSKLTLEDLGRATRIMINQETTTFVQGGGSAHAVRARTNHLRAQLEDTRSEYERDRLQARLDRLIGGVAVVRIGASSRAAIRDKAVRVEEALRATRAALREGTIAGGAAALGRVLDAVDALGLDADQQIGVDIVRHAVEQAIDRNAKTTLEPTMVVRLMLLNAASAASRMLNEEKRASTRPPSP